MGPVGRPYDTLSRIRRFAEKDSCVERTVDLRILPVPVDLLWRDIPILQRCVHFLGRHVVLLHAVSNHLPKTDDQMQHLQRDG